ncbi:hypothetical protein TIFTF001_003845 [Ficus carica]|uniref:Uncharacterized protein n=1 Tax=Ficus carica TaxID=3494 RepID=A0AA87ZDA2_FICCA|nr:hypothetical protein TIFTF001_003845 [Ficus carica]
MMHIMISHIVTEEMWKRFRGMHNPQWSSTALMVAKEKKIMESRGDIPDIINTRAPLNVSTTALLMEDYIELQMHMGRQAGDAGSDVLVQNPILMQASMHETFICVQS